MKNIALENIQHGTASFNYAVYKHGPQHYGYAFTPHWHEEYELVYVKKGNFHFLINGQYFHVKEGQALLIDQYAIHMFPDFQNHCNGEYISYLFGRKFIFPSSSSYISEQFYDEMSPQKVSLSQLITGEFDWQKEVLQYASRLEELSLQPLKNALSIQIALLSIFNQIKINKAYILMQDNSMTKNEFIKKALIYIHQNYSKDISVSRIAGSLHISTNHFIRVFKFLLGVTPQKYIQTYRIQQAINAMHSAQGVSELSVSDIVFEVGFHDLSYFSRRFKKETGLTPSQYINRLNRQDNNTVYNHNNDKDIHT